MIDTFLNLIVSVFNSSFLLILALVYFWGTALMDVYVVSGMDQRSQQMATFVFMLHFFFLMIISLFALKHLP